MVDQCMIEAEWMGDKCMVKDRCGWMEGLIDGWLDSWMGDRCVMKESFKIWTDGWIIGWLDE